MICSVWRNCLPNSTKWWEFLGQLPRPDLGDLGGRLKDSTTKPAQKSRFRTQIYCVAVQQSAGHDQLLMICIYHLQDSCGLNSDRCHANWGGSKGRKRNGDRLTVSTPSKLQRQSRIEPAQMVCIQYVHFFMYVSNLFILCNNWIYGSTCAKHWISHFMTNMTQTVNRFLKKRRSMEATMPKPKSGFMKWKNPITNLSVAVFSSQTRVAEKNLASTPCFLKGCKKVKRWKVPTFRQLDLSWQEQLLAGTKDILQLHKSFLQLLTGCW